MPRSPTPRRDAILEAALDCFASYGFAKTTMDDIRLRAGASTGSLYHHFKSKEQLAAELYLEGVRRYQQGLRRELGRHGVDPRDVVRRHQAFVHQRQYPQRLDLRPARAAPGRAGAGSV